jgi:predicted amidohydrolase
VYVVVANRTGREELGGIEATFRGGSTIFDPRGTDVATASGPDGTCRAGIRPSDAGDKSTAMFRDLADHYRAYDVTVAEPDRP